MMKAVKFTDLDEEYEIYLTERGFWDIRNDGKWLRKKDVKKFNAIAIMITSAIVGKKLERIMDKMMVYNVLILSNGTNIEVRFLHKL